MPKTRKGSSIELYNSHFAATLRELMEKHGTTQKELADAVGFVHNEIALLQSQRINAVAALGWPALSTCDIANAVTSQVGFGDYNEW